MENAKKLNFDGVLEAGGTLIDAGAGIAASMLSSGFPLKVFGALVALVGAVTGIKILLEIIEGEGFGGALEELIKLILSAGIFLFLLNNYELVFKTSLKSLFDGIAAAGGFGKGAGDLLGGFQKIMGSIGGAFKVIFPESASWFTLIGLFFYHLLAVVIFLAAILVIVAAMAGYVIVYVMGDALAAIALALGPFFVALGVWEVTRGWFRNWVEFLATAFMYKVVASVIVLLVGMGFADQLSKIAESAQSSINGEPVTAMMSLLLSVKSVVLAGVVLFLMLQAPQIAHGIMRGGMSVGEEGLKKLAGMGGKGSASATKGQAANVAKTTEQLSKEHAALDIGRWGPPIP